MPTVDSSVDILSILPISTTARCFHACWILKTYMTMSGLTHGTTTLLCECDKTNYSWVYLPNLKTKCHRIIMTGNFSTENSAPDLSPNRTTCTVEYSGYLSEHEMHCELETLPFNMQPVAYNYCKNSYIIHNETTASLMRTTTQALAEHAIFCCGRFAEWEYFNMESAISSAFKVASKLRTYLK